MISLVQARLANQRSENCNIYLDVLQVGGTAGDDFEASEGLAVQHVRI